MAEERKQIARVWFWVGAAVLLVIVFLVSKHMTRDRLPVHAATVSRATLESTIPTNGVVEPEKNFTYHSPLATTVRSISVSQGDRVKAGQLLMQLDDITARARLASAESALHSAQASDEAIHDGGTLEERQSLSSTVTRDQLDVAQKQRDLGALQKLQTTGAASASEVEISRQRLALAQDTLQTDQGRQKTRYSAAERTRSSSAVADAQANLVAARAILDQTSFRAPIDGTVYSIPVGRSDFVEEGKMLLQIADLTQVRVRAYFDEPEIGRLAVGQKILIVWEARQGREWHGHITQVPSTVVTAGTRNVGEVLVAIDDADNGLLPDTHVTVTVTTSSEPNVLTVPREAVYKENGKPYVYRIVDGNLQRTSVTTGTFNMTQEVVTSGLNDGDVVAMGSISGIALEDGVPVKVVR
ncbi:efflux RND transporter periplasmic adaptor subunit [Acidicapsa ligni]|uniref:efflux RND transporter periplasmic adaptor subunit n=1 Tax=Acidicapsa ligni TaxID=542300 RepID=UPI0021DFB825|nr:efflux RND transporter periplasmic adaptor subunit [Acidicapsa ligni]